MIRVTEVINYHIQPELHNWILRIGKAKAETISKKAREIGTEVDELVQIDINGKDYQRSDKPEVLSCMSAWHRARREKPWLVKDCIGMQEEITDGEVIGHYDLLIDDGERWGIVDVKTSRAIRPEYWTQVAKYWQMKKKDMRREPSFVGILRLDKVSESYEYQELTNPADIYYELSVFDAYLVTFRHAEKVRERVRRILEEELLDVS